MAAPWTAEWTADWNRLTSLQQLALECQYDGPIPHDAILFQLAQAEAGSQQLAAE